MKTTRPWFGLVGALLPVLFFGGLFLYFDRVSDATYGMLDGALGPTRLGLGGLAILFALLFLWKLKRSAAPPPPTGGAGLDAAVEEPRSDFDPDAAMARYLARRGAAPTAGPTGSAPSLGGDAPRPPAGSFGRKGIRH